MTKQSMMSMRTAYYFNNNHVGYSKLIFAGKNKDFKTFLANMRIACQELADRVQ